MERFAYDVKLRVVIRTAVVDCSDVYSKMVAKRQAGVVRWHWQTVPMYRFILCAGRYSGWASGMLWASWPALARFEPFHSPEMAGKDVNLPLSHMRTSGAERMTDS